MAKAHKRISKMLTRKASNAPSESNSESFDDGKCMHELFYVQCVHVHMYLSCYMCMVVKGQIGVVKPLTDFEIIHK